MHFSFLCSSASYANRLGTLIRKTPFSAGRKRERGKGGQSAVNFQVLLPQVLGKLRSLCRVPSSFLSFCLSFINWKTFLSKLCHFLCERQTPLFSDSTSEVFGFNRANAFPAVLRSARQEFISACKAASRGICRVQFKLNFNFICRSRDRGSNPFVLVAAVETNKLKGDYHHFILLADECRPFSTPSPSPVRFE